MEFLQLKYFQHAAKTENFSRTAETYMVPTSSVSSSIKKLEIELGTTLFDREANKISLNDSGKILLKSVDVIFKEMDIAKQQLLQLKSDVSGTIHLLVHTNRRIITEKISEFHMQYPDVSFVIDFYDSKLHKYYDIMITDTTVDDRNFQHSDFINEEIMIAIPSTNPLSERKNVSMSLLKNEHFICLPKKHSLRTLTDYLCKQAGFEPDIVIECNDIFYIREYLKMGLGISLIPTISWKNQLDSSVSLVRIQNGIYRHSKIYLNVKSSLATKTFRRFLQNEI